MTFLGWTIAGLLAATLIYAVLVIALILAGRRGEARALAGFIPDCVVLFKRILADDRDQYGGDVANHDHSGCVLLLLTRN